MKKKNLTIIETVFVLGFIVSAIVGMRYQKMMKAKHEVPMYREIPLEKYLADDGYSLSCVDTTVYTVDSSFYDLGVILHDSITHQIASIIIKEYREDEDSETPTAFIIKKNGRLREVIDKRDRSTHLQIDTRNAEVSHLFVHGKAIKGNLMRSPQVTAEFALTILSGIYGEDNIRGELPLNVVSFGPFWEVCGTLPAQDFVLGGVAYIDILKENGKVIDYWHEK